jgi:hypothetical protein
MACLISKKGSSLHDKSATHVPAHVLPMSPVHTMNNPLRQESQKTLEMQRDC